jgi:phage gpG-like protein
VAGPGTLPLSAEVADNVELRIDVDGIGKYLKGMLSRTQQVRGWLNRNAYQIIKNAQYMRWMTEGASEGEGWAPLNPKYAKYKLKKFRDYPGQGRKMLVATGRLASAMTGGKRTSQASIAGDAYKLATDTSLEVGTTISYAKYVNEARNIVELSPETVQALEDELRDYLVGKK